ncbi:hypothetical protein [Novosphingobium clariflavum]|uniref:Energy transducer TonB n=1 Tax=Novosphingobium clariflavum TaxID=2029884 RepID=A0ABV6S7E1_9SPHN|nr:hypothetical protein [Novosphingobium clariflavum]
MAGNIPPNLIEPVATAQHFVPPSSRELRAQAVHRLQVGLFGLCAMLLIVGLANIIMDRARLVDAEDPIRDVVAVDAKPKRPVADPLADIGVIPSPEASPTPNATDGSLDSAGPAPLATQ